MLIDSANIAASYNLARIIEASKTKRVVGIQLQNSNGLHHGYGYDNGIPKGFATAGSGIWGSGLLTGYGGNSSGGYGAAGVVEGSTTTGAPSELSAYIGSSSSATGIHAYAWWSGSGNANAIAYIGGSSTTPGFIRSGQSLRLTVARATIPSSVRSWRYSARSSYNYAAIGSSSLTYTDVGASYGMTVDQYTTASLSANDAASGIEISTGAAWAATPNKAPGFVSYMQVDNPALTSGWAWTTLIARGGQPLKTQATDAAAITTAQYVHFFNEAWRLADAGKYTLVVINEGFNSRNDTTNSIGPSPAAGNTKAGWKDNAMSIINTITAAYLAAGGPIENLGFLLMTDHSESASDPVQAAFATGADELAYASRNVGAFRSQQLYTSAELLALSYLYASDDTAHLSTAGYDVYGAKIARELSAYTKTEKYLLLRV